MMTIRHNHAAFLAGRRLGKTHQTRWLMLWKAATTGLRVIYYVPTPDDVRQAWDDVTGIIDGYRLARPYNSSRRIQFVGGGSITIRSAFRGE